MADFRTATDHLFSKLGADDLAEALGCSTQAIRQARTDSGSTSYRAPPAGWEAAVRKLALAQAAALTKLAKSLSQD